MFEVPRIRSASKKQSSTENGESIKIPTQVMWLTIWNAWWWAQEV